MCKTTTERYCLEEPYSTTVGNKVDMLVCERTYNMAELATSILEGAKRFGGGVRIASIILQYFKPDICVYCG
jgi:hypothetical protein